MSDVRRRRSPHRLWRRRCRRGLPRETSGLYPHSGIGLVGNWFALLVLTCCGIAAAVWRLHKQGIGWSVGRG
jgi:hypothetical protein